MSHNSRPPGTLRQKYMKKICDNPACSVQIKSHLWVHKGVYCGPWCERNFGEDPSEKKYKKRK